MAKRSRARPSTPTAAVRPLAAAPRPAPDFGIVGVGASAGGFEEELQSTNEEILSSNEELQSTNEELNTVNDELQVRNEELTRVNADLINLLASVQIAIVIVARDACAHH